MRCIAGDMVGKGSGVSVEATFNFGSIFWCWLVAGDAL